MATYYIGKTYSEAVVRSSVAWTFRGLEPPAISLTDAGWAIESSEASPEIEASLLRNVNEMRARELIDDQTLSLRREIVKKSLMNLYRG